MLDEESSKIAAISTHRGTFLVKRLFFGLSTAPSLFHAVFDPILSGLPGCAAYFDDIVIFGKTKNECERNLETCLKRLQNYNITHNASKCKFFERKIKYLGHVISENGLEKNPQKIKAIVEMPAPKNLHELRSFLGMVQFYSQFIPDTPTLLQPLNRLLHKDVKFTWSKICEKCIPKTKK